MCYIVKIIVLSVVLFVVFRWPLCVLFRLSLCIERAGGLTCVERNIFVRGTIGQTLSFCRRLYTHGVQSSASDGSCRRAQEILPAYLVRLHLLQLPLGRAGALARMPTWTSSVAFVLNFSRLRLSVPWIAAWGMWCVVPVWEP